MHGRRPFTGVRKILASLIAGAQVHFVALTRMRTPSGTWQIAVFGGALVLIAFVIYWPALFGQFIWDDHAYVTANPLVHAPDGVYRMWFTGQAIDYWPVTNTLYWVEWRLWGLQPTGYHAVNVLLHAANALLFWTILRRLDIPNAWLAALLFVVHPVNVESVAWIAERKNTLSMLFLLLTTFWYVVSEAGSTADTAPVKPARHGRIERRRQASLQTPPVSGRQNRSRHWWYLLSVVAFGLAMLSKGSVATLPGILLLIVWWQRGRLAWRDIGRALPLVAIAIALTLMNIWFQMRHVTEQLRDISPVERLLGAGAIVWFYLYKTLVPIKLMFVYPQWGIRADDVRWWIPAVAAIATTAILWWNRQRPIGRGLLLAWGIFCLALVPVMGLTDVYFMRYSPVADQYVYIALLAVVAAVAAGLSRVTGPETRSLPSGGSRPSRVLPLRAACASVVIALGAATWMRSHLYADATTLWAATIRDNPMCWLCETNLAVPLVARGTPAGLTEAIEHLNAALRLNPRAPESHDGLGVALQKMGRFDEAVAEHERALALNPRFSEARANLVVARENQGIALSAAGQFDKAAAVFALVLHDAPNRADAHRELGYALLQLGRTDDSLVHLNEAVRLDPASAETHDTLASVWRTLHRPEQAIAEYREAVKLAPNAADWHNNLGAALLDNDQLEEAAHEFRESLRCDPRSANAHRNLGVTLAAMDRLEEAAEQLREALRLDPGFSDARLSLDEVTARIRRK